MIIRTFLRHILTDFIVSTLPYDEINPTRERADFSHSYPRASSSTFLCLSLRFYSHSQLFHAWEPLPDVCGYITGNVIANPISCLSGVDFFSFVLQSIKATRNGNTLASCQDCSALANTPLQFLETSSTEHSSLTYLTISYAFSAAI